MCTEIGVLTNLMFASNFCLKHAFSELLKLKAYSAERKGERDEMQDKHVIIENFMPFVKELSSEMYLSIKK